MNKRIAYTVALLLLNGCVSQWPRGSYNELPRAADSEAVTNSISECASYLVPNHAMVSLDSGPDALSMLMPEALSRQGLQANPAGIPLTYIVASTGTDSRARENEGAFIRVTTPRGTCSQYFTRDTNGVLQNAGPVMVVLK